MISPKKTFAAVLLCAFAINALPTHAESLQVNDIERDKRINTQNAPAVQLRTKSKAAAKCENSRDGKSVTGPANQPGETLADEKQPNEDQPAAPAAKQSPDQTSAGQQQQEVISEGDCSGSGVQQIDLCDVTGTVCEDCGEIVLAGGVLPEFAETGVLIGGGFPISPLFSLAAIPLALLPALRRSSDDQPLSPPNIVISVPPFVPPPPNVVPTPPPPAAPIPEPISLLLFGSGLSVVAASVRRRQKSQLERSKADRAVAEG